MVTRLCCSFNNDPILFHSIIWHIIIDDIIILGHVSGVEGSERSPPYLGEFLFSFCLFALIAALPPHINKVPSFLDVDARVCMCFFSLMFCLMGYRVVPVSSSGFLCCSPPLCFQQFCTTPPAIYLSLMKTPKSYESVQITPTID